MVAEGIWRTIQTAVTEHQIVRIDPVGRMAAAVLVPLIPHASEPHVLFTVRSHDVEYHRGEVSFPGGACDPTDPDLLFTALRESHEEVGIRPHDVQILGEQSHQLIWSGFHITPYVGVLARAPYDFEPREIEVSQLLEIPLSHLLDPANLEDMPLEREGRRTTTRAYRYGEHRVYGATAFILRRFLDDVIRRLDYVR